VGVKRMGCGGIDVSMGMQMWQQEWGAVVPLVLPTGYRHLYG